MTETAKFLKSCSSKAIKQKIQYATGDLRSEDPLNGDKMDQFGTYDKTFVLSDRELGEGGIEIKDNDYQSVTTRQYDELSNFGKHTPQSRKIYQTPIIHVQLVKSKAGISSNKLNESKELQEMKDKQISQFDPHGTAHLYINDKENAFGTTEKKVKGVKMCESTQKTPKQQCFHKYLNCQPGQNKQHLKVKSKRSAQEFQAGRTTAQHYDHFLQFKENKPISPLLSKQNSICEQPFIQYPKNPRRSSFANSKRNSHIKPQQVNLTDRQNCPSIKDVLFEEMISAKLKNIDHHNRKVGYSRLSEQSTLQKILGTQILQNNPTHQNSINKIPIDNETKKRQTSHSKPKDKNIKNIDEEIYHLLKEYDKRNQVARNKASYTRTDLLKLLKNFDMDHKSQEKRIKEYVKRMETNYCEKLQLEKQCKEQKEKLDHLNLVANKYANKEYVDSLVEGMTECYSVLKQMGISVGFFLSLYKEVEDYEDFQFMNENPHIQPLSDILQKYNLQEIYTDIDQVQNLVDKCDNLVHDNLLQLGKITSEIQRSKSTKTCRESSLSGFQQLLVNHKRERGIHQKRKCYHDNCLVRNDKTINREISEMKASIKKLRRENYQKDNIIKELKKKIDFTEEMTSMAQKIQEQEQEIENLRKEQVVKVQIENNNVNQVMRNQKELDQILMQNNYLKEREKQLLAEIKEVRGLLQNEQNFNQVEKTLKQISGILVSNVQDLNLSDPQMRQFITLFNFYDQAMRYQKGLKVEFEQSGRLIDILMDMFTLSKAKLSKDQEIMQAIDKYEAQVKDILFQRENRFKSFENQWLSGTLKSPLIGKKEGCNGFGSTVSSSLIDGASGVQFDETSQISLRRQNDHQVFSIFSDGTTQERSKSIEKKNNRKQSIKKLKQNLNKMNEENLKLKTQIAEMKNQGQNAKKGKTQNLNFVNDLLKECEDLKVFDI